MSVYIGIDWSAQKHDIVFLNEAGASIARQTIPHQATGFQQLDETRQSLNVPVTDCLVGIETAHNVLIDYLWGQGYSQVYVIPPTVVKSSRGRYGSSGSRSDQMDAQLLADILRTDRARLQPWRPDSLLTRQIRAKVSLVHHLTKSVRRGWPSFPQWLDYWPWRFFGMPWPRFFPTRLVRLPLMWRCCGAYWEPTRSRKW